MLHFYILGNTTLAVLPIHTDINKNIVPLFSEFRYFKMLDIILFPVMKLIE